MRLEDWQKYIETQFIESTAAEPASGQNAEQRALPLKEANPIPDTALALPMLSLPSLFADEETEESPGFSPCESPAPAPLPQPCPEEEDSIPVFRPVATPGAGPKATDGNPAGEAPLAQWDVEIPSFAAYMPSRRAVPDAASQDMAEQQGTASPDAKQRRSPARRARHARNVRPENVPSGLSAAELWARMPRHIETLLALERREEQETAQSSYKRPFQDKRRELIERLLDPILTLEETARLLNVCPTTVRRYTNKGILTYTRKEPERAARTGESEGKETRQRRFRLSDILAFLETQQAAIEADRAVERPSGQGRAERTRPEATSEATEEDR